MTPREYAETWFGRSTARKTKKALADLFDQAVSQGQKEGRLRERAKRRNDSGQAGIIRRDV